MFAAGKFPYSEWSNLFQQLKEVVDGAPPRLADDGRFSADLRDFTAVCLHKDPKMRPKYRELLQHPFLKTCDLFHTIVFTFCLQLRGAQPR